MSALAAPVATSQAAPAIVIDQQFQALIPPLRDEERHELENSLMREGCRDRLTVWKETRILLDGHNRFAICEAAGIPFDVYELSFANREDAEDWMDRNQLGRRNLSPDQAAILRGRRYNRAKKRQGAPAGNANRSAKQKSQSATFEPAKSTAQRIGDEHGVDRATIFRDAQFAAAVDKLKTQAPDIERRIVQGGPAAPARRDVIKAAELLEKAPEKARAVLDGQARLTTPHLTLNTGDNEWYTPDDILDAARDVLGVIDLDPASSAIAQTRVRARLHFDKDTDGLMQPWRGRVWLNPPYARGLIDRFVQKLVEEFKAGNVTAAILLTNNATDAKWFGAAAAVASRLCLPHGRIRFLSPGGEAGAPLQGQSVFYLGSEGGRFTEVFQQFGPTWMVANSAD